MNRRYQFWQRFDLIGPGVSLAVWRGVKNGWDNLTPEFQGQGRCAFATQALAARELLLEEEPFYTRMPPKQLQGRPEWDEALDITGP